MIARSLASVLALVLGLAAACGPDAGEYPLVRTERLDAGMRRDAGTDAGPMDGGPPVVPDEPLEDWDTTDAGPLTGIFAVEVVIPAQVVVEVEARQLYRLRIVQHETNLRMRVSPCRIDLPAVEGVAELTIPPALETTLQSKSVEESGAYLSAADPIGATFSPPPAALVLGAAIDDPLTDPLPASPDDPTEVDEDGDGNPGVTVDAVTVLCRNPERAFLALRAVAELDAVIDDVDAFEGDVTPNLEWSILGVTHDCLAAAAELVIEILPGSTFRAIRVGDAEDLDENGNVSCPEIGWAAVPLFGEAWR